MGVESNGVVGGRLHVIAIMLYNAINSPVPVSSLYIHVPFCASKCSYCAFYSHAPGDGLVDRYVEALCREMEFIAADCQPRTVFFGGGTPSILNIRQWERVLMAMENHGLTGAEEWTVECNPATVSADKARLLRGAGVNRISMGVQTLDAGLLERIGRIHSREQVFKSVDILRAAGIENLNLDLMFAIPTQTMEQWRASLREVTAMEPEHLSAYEVIYEQDTPLFEQLQAGAFDVDEALACAMYDELVDFASARGWHQYEVANFARHEGTADFEIPNRASRHNVNYWRGGDCHSLGPSATAYVDGVRTKNIANTQIYCERLERGEGPLDTREELPPLSRAGETAAFGLRMTAGWPFDEFQRVTGFDLRDKWRESMAALVAQGNAVLEEDGFRLNAKGLRFADAAAMEFLR